jgi:aspartate/methionine/tyrosine aminotransferase
MKINGFKLERFFARYEFTAPYLLCTSDCESFTVEDLFQLDENAERDFKNLRLGYTETAGSPVLREEISRLYTGINPEDVLVCAGAQEGIFIFMNALLNPGDRVIVQFPAYQSLYEIANALGCGVTLWPMDANNNWELDPDFPGSAVTPGTKAIVINLPNNPTGYNMSKEKLNRLVGIAREHDIYIFSDEVYRFLEYDEKDRLPAVCDIYDKGVTLGVMSKSFGLAGLRIGWLVTKDKTLFKQMASFKDFTTICSSAPGEFLTILALRHKNFILERNLEIIRSNLRLLESFFNRYSDRFQRITPNAGPLVFPKLLFTGDAEAFCLDLVEKKGVLLAPGNMFNYDSPYVRVGFGRKNMPDALSKLEEYVNNEN